MSLFRRPAADRRRLQRGSRTALAICCRTVAAFVLALVISATALAQSYVPGQILVGYRPGATAEQAAAVEVAFGLTLLKDFPHIGARLYRLPPGTPVEDAVPALQALAIVLYAEPNHLHRLRATPTDPRFSEQWYLSNIGQTVNGVSGAAGEDINWLPAMSIFSGTKVVVVAVVDSGIALRHPEFVASGWVNPKDIANGVDDDLNSFVDDVIGWDFFDRRANALDVNGHGTLVASLIAADAGNGEGGVGVSPTARVMALRVANSVGQVLPSGNVMSAFTYAAVRGARVINASFGGAPFSSALLSTIEWLNSKGVLVVAAAGNGGDDGLGDNNDVTPEYPASYAVPNVISVAATDRFGDLATFSNFGASRVHLAAPGFDMFGAYVHRRSTFFDDFTTGAVGWTTGVTPFSGFDAPWSIFIDANGGRWAVDSVGNYLPNVDSFFVSPPIQAGRLGTQISYRRQLLLNVGDCFALEISTDDGASWLISGTCGPVLSPPEVSVFDLSQFDGMTIRLRFRFASDGFLEADGVYVGQVQITNVEPFFYDGTQYTFDSGTSFAAPLVAGAAALVWSQRPDLTVSQVRQVLLSTVRPAAGLADKVASGGKLDVFAALQAAINVPPGLVLSTDAVDFGPQVVGGTDAAQTVTLLNAGGESVTFQGMTTSDAAVFPAAADCAGELLPGAVCTVSASFLPGTVGEVSGVLTIASTALGSPHVVNVVGAGTPPGSPGEGGPDASVLLPREVPDLSREVPSMPREVPSLPQEVPSLPRDVPALPREVPSLGR
jgi:subtilisin family serine protease